MTACELCSGRHSTSTCVIGQDSIAQCFRPEDPKPAPENVVSIGEFATRRSVPFGGAAAAHERWHPSEGKRAIEHWGVRIATNEGLRVERLA